MSTTFTVADTAPALTGTCRDGDAAADLSGATLAAHIRQPDGTVLTKTATATDAVNGAWLWRGSTVTCPSPAPTRLRCR